MWRVGAVDLAWGGSDRRERTRKEVRGGGGQPGFRDLVVGDPDEDTAGTIHATTTVDEVARVPIPVLPSQPPSFQRRRSVKPVQGHERPSVHVPTQALERGPVVAADEHPSVEVVAVAGRTAGGKLERPPADDLDAPHPLARSGTQSHAPRHARSLDGQLPILIIRHDLIQVVESTALSRQPPLGAPSHLDDQLSHLLRRRRSHPVKEELAGTASRA